MWTAYLVAVEIGLGDEYFDVLRCGNGNVEIVPLAGSRNEVGNGQHRVEGRSAVGTGLYLEVLGKGRGTHVPGAHADLSDGNFASQVQGHKLLPSGYDGRRRPERRGVAVDDVVVQKGR